MNGFHIIGRPVLDEVFHPRNEEDGMLWCEDGFQVVGTSDNELAKWEEQLNKIEEI
tara:strand:+ start:320 stop:487 length:168 start_codon:yes stop_codon:yes gene_type:complete